METLLKSGTVLFYVENSIVGGVGTDFDGLCARFRRVYEMKEGVA